MSLFTQRIPRQFAISLIGPSGNLKAKKVKTFFPQQTRNYKTRLFLGFQKSSSHCDMPFLNVILLLQILLQFQVNKVRLQWLKFMKSLTKEFNKKKFEKKYLQKKTE